MFKAVILLRRRAGMTHEEFTMNFRVHMRPLMAALPGVRRIVVSDAIAGPGGTPVYDGMAEFWFDSVDAVRSLVESSATKAIEAEMARFVDMDAYETFLTVETELGGHDDGAEDGAGDGADAVAGPSA